jgi:hypothetical protein
MGLPSPVFVWSLRSLCLHHRGGRCACRFGRAEMEDVPLLGYASLSLSLSLSLSRARARARYLSALPRGWLP